MVEKRVAVLIAPLDFTVALCCKYIINNLTSLGYQVYVLSPTSTSEQYRKSIIDYGAKHYSIPMSRHINLLSDIFYVIRIFNFLRRNNSRLVFSVCTKPNIYAPLASFLLRIPTIISIWGRGTLFGWIKF